MIKIGDKLPSVTLKSVTGHGATDVDSATYLADGKVIFFSVPGAFTPTCSNNHLPGFIAEAPKFRQMGVNKIVCATVNDHHVVKAWAESQNALDNLEFLADFDGQLAKSLGMSKDMSKGGLGDRFVRAALIIDHGKVQDIFIDDVPGQVTSSGASEVLDSLKKYTAKSVA